MQVVITGRVADSAGVHEAGRIEFAQAQRIDTGELLVTRSIAVAQVVDGQLRSVSGGEFSLPSNPEGTAVRIREMLGGETFEWWAAVPEVESIEYRELPIVESGSVPQSVWAPPPWVSEVRQLRDETVDAIDEGLEAIEAIGGVAGIQAAVGLTQAYAAASAGSANAASASATRAEAAADSIDMDAINERLDVIEGVAEGAVQAPPAPQDGTLLVAEGGDYVPAGIGTGLVLDGRVLKADVRDLVAELRYPHYIAHRGSTSVYPESSMLGFRRSFEAGFSLEMDVWKLSDDKLAVWHDSTTGARLTGANTSLVTMTSQQWKDRRILPHRIDDIVTSTLAPTTTFDQILDEFGGRVVLWPEIKDANATNLVINAILERGLQRSVVVQTVSWAIVQQLVSAGIYTMYRNPTMTPQQCKDAGVSFIGIPASSSAQIASYRAVGLKVVIFTNSKATHDSLLSLNCDGIASDDPWMLSGRLDYGMRLRLDGERAPMMKSLSSGGSTNIEIRGDDLNFWQSAGANAFNSLSVGALGIGGPSVRIGLTVTSFLSKTSPAADSTLMFALYLGKREDRGPILPGNTGEMYRAVMVRRDGRMQLENKPTYAGAVTVLGNSPVDSNVQPSNGPSVPMEFEILFEPTRIWVRNRTRMITYEQAHASWAGVDGLYPTLHVRGADSLIQNVWSQAII